MWPMLNYLGVSVYLSTFEKQKPMLNTLKNSGAFVFTSFHIQEEMEGDYCLRAREMCRWLKQYDFKIIGDVSPRTLQFFGEESLLAFGESLKLDVLRLDYGFTDTETAEISNHMPIAYNASTIDEKLINQMLLSKRPIYAMHNFYPRPETGLDEEFFRRVNQRLTANSIEVWAFIPGDELTRGPIYEGLPTLESHRRLPPYVAFLDLLINYGVQGVFVGDVSLSQQQLKLITAYLKSKIIEIPAVLLGQHEGLYGQVFTIRADSPRRLMRLQESREYATMGPGQEPDNCIHRLRGHITMDNIGYQRYSGEIQILRENLPQDDRVNVIGSVVPDYLPILDCINNTQQIRLIYPL